MGTLFPPFIELHYSFGYIWELESVFLELTLGIVLLYLDLLAGFGRKKSGENENYEDKDTN